MPEQRRKEQTRKGGGAGEHQTGSHRKSVKRKPEGAWSHSAREVPGGGTRSTRLYYGACETKGNSDNRTQSVVGNRRTSERQPVGPGCAVRRRGTTDTGQRQHLATSCRQNKDNLSPGMEQKGPAAGVQMQQRQRSGQRRRGAGVRWGRKPCWLVAQSYRGHPGGGPTSLTSGRCRGWRGGGFRAATSSSSTAAGWQVKKQWWTPAVLYYGGKSQESPEHGMRKSRRLLLLWTVF